MAWAKFSGWNGLSSLVVRGVCTNALEWGKVRWSGVRWLTARQQRIERADPTHVLTCRGG